MTSAGSCTTVYIYEVCSVTA